MCRIMKLMSQGLLAEPLYGGLFITSILNPGILGAHMLEVDPHSLQENLESVHPLGIGVREDPARLCFESKMD